MSCFFINLSGGFGGGLFCGKRYGGSTTLLGISYLGLGSNGSTAETASPLIMIGLDSEDPGAVY